MERITAINEYGEAYYPKCFEKCNACDIDKSICETLAAYENTELTPDQLIKIDDMYKDLCREVEKYRKLEDRLKNEYHANVDIEKLIEMFIETIFKGEEHEGFCILTNEDAKEWEVYKETAAKYKAEH